MSRADRYGCSGRYFGYRLHNITILNTVSAETSIVLLGVAVIVLELPYFRSKNRRLVFS
jgi:hypothetical protein